MERLLFCSLYVRYNSFGGRSAGALLQCFPVDCEAMMKMAKQERTDEYFEIVEKVKKIFAGIAEQLSKLSPNELAVIKRGLKLLVRKTPAGAERLAILHLLETP